MKIGIPKSLLYFKYHPFIESLLYELGAEVVISADTNKNHLDEGVKYCVDEACLPVKIFHGHTASLKNNCDMLLIPRIMQLRKREFICPKFCGLPEMIKNSIPDLPPILSDPIYAYSEMELLKWVKSIARLMTKNASKVEKAYKNALAEQKNHQNSIQNEKCRYSIALAGHPYNIYDSFANMNLSKKLKNHNISVLTEEFVTDANKDEQIKALYKKPFWTFARDTYGFATYLAEQKLVNGIVYISSFACGIDSVVIELIKNRLGDFPFLILKIDEHTGEAGFDTRLEAFADMLEWRDS